MVGVKQQIARVYTHTHTHTQTTMRYTFIIEHGQREDETRENMYVYFDRLMERYCPHVVGRRRHIVWIRRTVRVLDEYTIECSVDPDL